MKQLRTLLSWLGATTLLAGLASAQYVEDFENGNPDGWQMNFTGTINGFAVTAAGGALAAGNPGSGLQFLNHGTDWPNAWWLNSPTSTDWRGDLRGKGVTGFSLDMLHITTATSPFGNHMYVVLGDDNGTPTEYADDLLCWSNFDGAQYGFLGFGAPLASGTWNTISWPCDASSATRPAGWTVNDWNNTFAGDQDTAWNVIIQDVDYVAFINNAPWGSNPFGAADYTFDNITMTTGAVGTAYCFCDGSGMTAPCGNGGAAGNGCGNGSNSSGANLSATGNPSASGSSLVLAGAGSAPGQPGLYFQGDVATNSGMGLIFGDGLRCAGTNVVRLEVANSDASGNSATTIDIATKGGVSAGQTRYYQLWYRDPAGSPCGALFNTSNGLEVIWGS